MTAGCWLLVLPGLAGATVRLFGIERGVLVQLVAFTPYLAAWAVVPLALTLALRRLPAAAVGGVAALALIGVVAPRAVPDAGPAAGGPIVRVLTANLLAGSANPAELVRLVRIHRVDVLTLQEFTPDIDDGLRRHGLLDLVPYGEASLEVGTTGSAVYARFRLVDGGIRRNEGGFGQAYGTLVVPGAAPLLVESAHPAAPYAVSALPDWWADLRAQPAATPDGPLRILAGDFNATLDHAPLRALIDTGYADAAEAAGTGLTGTWGPYDGDPIPPVTIDHVLCDRRIGVVDASVRALPGSDHRAVLAELRLPAP